MPTTVAGLIVLVVALSPGFCYVLRRERLAPNRSVSSFRESLAVILTSVFSVILVLGLLALLRVAFPGATPDTSKLVRNPSAYFRADYAVLSLWAVGLLSAACILCLFAAQLPAWSLRLDGHSRLLGWLSSRLDRDTPVQFVSAWWRLFETQPEKYKLVRCQLDDGSLVQGLVHSYSVKGDETADREIVLRAPLVIRHATGGLNREERGALAISSRRIVYLYVDYIDPP
jgi:Family of unknown function (DUF6338)